MAKARGRKTGDEGNGAQKPPVANGCCNEAIDVASETVETMGHWGTESLDGARKAVRSRPLAACAATLTAGAIIGALLLR